LNIVEEMKSIAGINQHKDKNKPIMVGLAAPQIGYSIQLVFIDLSATAKRDGKFGNNLFMVNPKIVSYGKQKERGREGCYSCKPGNFDIRGVVERSKSVKIKFTDLNGENQVMELGGFTAVIAQHEVDHLDGKVFVHGIKNEKDLHIVFDSEYKLHKKNYKKWKRTMSPKLYFKEVCKI
jgi:peptide deformylase